MTVLDCMSVRLSEQASESGGCDRVTLAAVPMVSRAADQVAHEAQTEAHRANSLGVS